MTTKERKAKNEARKTNECLCGCSTKVRGNFAQGHDQRFRGYLLRAAEGTATNDELAAIKAAGKLTLKHGTTKPNAVILRAA